MRRRGATTVPIGIEELTFASGPDGSAPLPVRPTSVVILVGPNNSGKSLALREVEAFCSTADPETRVVSDMQITYPESAEEALRLLDKFKAEPPPGEITQSGRIYVKCYTPGRSESSSGAIHVQDVGASVQGKNKEYLTNNIIKWYTIRLDGKTRLSLTDNQPAASLQDAPANHLAALFKDDARRKKMRGLTKEALDRYFTIDPTGMSEFAIRLSRRRPRSSREERGLDDVSVRFHSEAQHISEFSDGINAFVGLAAAVMSLDHRIMMIDEPEAFLHPTLAQVLARNLAEIAQERGATLLASTHSSSFVLGAMDSRADVTLIRLTYDGERATTRVLESGQVSHMARSPLLRASRVIDALFSKATVVVEGDTDRVFYEAVNASMNVDRRGIDQCLFINAQSKQSLYKIAGPLRKMGIPAAVAADFDIVNLHKSEWGNLLDSVGVPGAASLYSACAGIVDEMDRLKKGGGDPIHRRGLDALAENSASASDLIRKMEKGGLFVVGGGTVETWLPDLPCKNWIEGALDLVDRDPQSRKLDGVRVFLCGIRDWINLQNQSGVRPAGPPGAQRATRTSAGGAPAPPP